MKPIKTLHLMALSSGMMLSTIASTASLAADLAWQVTPFAGYSSSMSFDSNDVSNLESKEGGNWGLMVHKETRDPGVIGVIFSSQNTDISPDSYGDLTIQYLHFSGALVSPDTLHPYIGAGAGLTRLSAYDSVIKPSMSLAVGIQPRLANNFAITAELRGYGTFFNSSSQFLCDPAVACKARVESNIMGQLQANLGMTFRF
jgi:hypothetical protein